MRVEKDFEDFIELLNKNDVKYMIVGAYALALYARPRNTGDIDVFVERDEKNAKKYFKSSVNLGLKVSGLLKQIY